MRRAALPRHHESGEDPDAQERDPEPEQADHRLQQLPHRRQVAEQSRLQVVVLQLAVEHQEHHPGHRGQRQRAVGENGHRRVGLVPRVRPRHPRRIRHQLPGEEGDALENHHHRRGEHAQQRDPVGRADGEVEKGERPREEGEDFPQPHQRAGPARLAADRQETHLREEGGDHPDHRPAAADALVNRPHAGHPAHGSEGGRGDQKPAVHAPPLPSKRGPRKAGMGVCHHNIRRKPAPGQIPAAHRAAWILKSMR